MRLRKPRFRILALALLGLLTAGAAGCSYSFSHHRTHRPKHHYGYGHGGHYGKHYGGHYGKHYGGHQHGPHCRH